MAHENTVSFKVFLKKAESDEKPEVRRFGIDRDVVSSFSYLKQKLQTVFPALRSKEIIVSWKDNEGDEIVISSDDELIIALTEMQSDVHKLYVSGKESSQQNPPYEGTHHAGVGCDGCNKDVDGFRYKCLQCHDYDLCASCESKGLHKEHFMIRLPVPVSWRPQYGRRLAHRLSKSSRKCSNSSGGRSGGECPWREQRQGHGQVPFLDMLGSYIGAFINPSLAEGEAHEPENETSTNQNTNATSNNAARDSHHAYLLNVGKTVAEMLDPLGIDVEVSVSDNKNQTAKTDQKKKSPQRETSPTKGESPAEDQVATNAQKPAQTEEIQNVPSDSARLQQGRESPESEGWTVLNQDTQQNQNSETTRQSEDKEPVALPPTPKVDETAAHAAEAAQMAASSAASAAAAAAMARASNAGAIPKHNFPVYYPPSVPYAGQQGAGWNPFAVPPNMYPVLPVPVPEAQPMQHPGAVPQQPLHPNPKVADAVQKMMSMGFSNEGGWLTQLLEIKGGDIEKALDVLQPVKK